MKKKKSVPRWLQIVSTVIANAAIVLAVVYIVFYIKKQPVTDQSLVKSYYMMYAREKYDLGITLPADEFSLLNLLKDDHGNLTVKVGEQTSTSKTSLGVEEMFEMAPETKGVEHVPFDVAPGSLVDESFLRNNYYDYCSRTEWQSVEEGLATTEVTSPVVNDIITTTIGSRSLSVVTVL